MRSVTVSLSLLIFSTVLVGCTAQSENQVPKLPDVPVPLSQESAVEKKTPEAKGVVSKNPSQVIGITAENWQFTPNVIRAKKGENVTLSIQGESGLHGFASKDLGINVTVEQGKTVNVALPTDKTGSFSFRCSIPCGQGHVDMRGTIVVEE